MRQKGLATRKKQNRYKLIIVNSSQLPDIDNKTILLLLALQQHYEEIVLDITNIASHDVVLGIP